MKCAGLETVAVPALEFCADAPIHLVGGVFGISKRKNLAGPSVPFANQAGDALRHHSGLPRPRASNHQHRAMNVSNGLLLAFIGNDLRRR
jgi:hypothetical protein